MRLLPDGVAPGNSPRRIQVADHLGIMISEYRALPCHARHDGLATPGKTGEEVRFNKTCQNVGVACNQLAIEPDIMPAAALAETYLRGRVEGVVLHDAVAVYNFGPQHAAQFGVRVGTVCAKRVE